MTVRVTPFISLCTWNNSGRGKTELTKPDLGHMKFLEEASKVYRGSIDQRVLSYLAGRGVREETAAYFHLGLVDDPLPGHEKYKGYLSIPYLKMGKVVAMKFRCIEEHKCRDIPHHQKHFCDGGQWVYNSDAIASPATVAGWFEGEPDVWVAHQSGFAAFGYPGADSFKGHPWWADLSEGFEQVLIFPDNDASKEGNPGLRGAQAFRQQCPRARIVLPPADRDTTDMYMGGGASALWEAAGIEWNDVRTPRLQLVG